MTEKKDTDKKNTLTLGSSKLTINLNDKSSGKSITSTHASGRSNRSPVQVEARKMFSLTKVKLQKHKIKHKILKRNFLM